MNSPLVHVLVINWNGIQHLEECFSSLLASTYLNVRFVLIDNGSSDGSVGFVRSKYGADPRVGFLELGENLGWSRGNNVAIHEAIRQHADYVFLLNNDTVTAPDAIQKLVEAAEADPRVGALAPKMLMYDKPDLINSVGLECSVIASSWDLGIGRLDGPRWDEVRPVIGVCGGAGFFRVAALKQAGVLPEDFEIYLDDLDLCLRIWDAGYEIRSCPEARVRHKFSATMGQGRQHHRKYYLNTRNRMYVMLRNFPIRKVFVVGPACVIGEIRAIGRALLDGEPWRAAAHIRAWAAGVGYAPRALRERIRRRLHPPNPLQRGNDACRFWKLIRTDCMFFHGTAFPSDGWYAPREIRGRMLRPMSARAAVDVEAGRLRLTHANCYPELGQTCIDVFSNSLRVTSLETLDCQECVLEVPDGTLTFQAKRIFEAEKTGENVDLGGWIGIDRV
jgi:GT2 family glycosyltransferase